MNVRPMAPTETEAAGAVLHSAYGRAAEDAGQRPLFASPEAAAQQAMAHWEDEPSGAFCGRCWSNSRSVLRSLVICHA